MLIRPLKNGVIESHPPQCHTMPQNNLADTQPLAGWWQISSKGQFTTEHKFYCLQEEFCSEAEKKIVSYRPVIVQNYTEAVYAAAWK